MRKARVKTLLSITHHQFTIIGHLCPFDTQLLFSFFGRLTDRGISLPTTLRFASLFQLLLLPVISLLAPNLEHLDIETSAYRIHELSPQPWTNDDVHLSDVMGALPWNLSKRLDSLQIVCYQDKVVLDTVAAVPHRSCRDSAVLTVLLPLDDDPLPAHPVPSGSTTTYHKPTPHSPTSVSPISIPM
ncbi:hypothetical protein IAR50_006248 [Cryptococcus sp. DSM 104548]